MLWNQSDELEIELTFDEKDPQRQVVVLELDNFPGRPARASRVRITMRFTDAVSGLVTVEDMGLGEFHESSGMRWEKQFGLIQKEET